MEQCYSDQSLISQSAEYALSIKAIAFCNTASQWNIQGTFFPRLVAVAERSYHMFRNRCDSNNKISWWCRPHSPTHSSIGNTRCKAVWRCSTSLAILASPVGIRCIVDYEDEDKHSSRRSLSVAIPKTFTFEDARMFKELKTWYKRNYNTETVWSAHLLWDCHGTKWYQRATCPIRNFSLICQSLQNAKGKRRCTARSLLHAHH